MIPLLFKPAFEAGAQETAPASATPQASLAPEVIIGQNTLQGEGKRPFHLKMDFQVFDLRGRPGEAGTLEYWWAGSNGTRLEITSPSLGAVHSTSVDDGASDRLRELFLVSELLTSVTSPAAVLGQLGPEIVTDSRTLSGIPLTCMHRVPPPSKYTSAQTDVCADAATGTIRLVSSKEHEVVRNRPARFGDARVTLDTTISWGLVKSISGHIAQLQSFDPAKVDVGLTKPTGDSVSERPDASSVRIAGGVLAGNKIGGSTPTYPASARMDGIQGTVLLSAVITKEGTISHLFALASPDVTLAAAAMDAVQHWTYKPYLLNGGPVSVTTTITVNFNLGSRR